MKKNNSKFVKWLKSLIPVSPKNKQLPQPRFIEGTDLFTPNKYKTVLVIEPDGKLYFNSKHLYGSVNGAGEWQPEIKKGLGISQELMVLDVLVNPIEIHE